jgi:hypothetical protein
MDFAKTWEQLTAMTTSDAVFATVAGYSITEKQVIWVGIALTIVVGGTLLKTILSWILGLFSNKKPDIIIIKEETRIKESSTTAPASVDTKKVEEKEDETASSPHEILADTSEKRRTLYDYVTPDTIHADIMKETMNSDYPYGTLKPPGTSSATTPVTGVAAPNAAVTTNSVMPTVVPPVTEPTPIPAAAIQQPTAGAQPPTVVLPPVQQEHPAVPTTDTPKSDAVASVSAPIFQSSAIKSDVMPPPTTPVIVPLTPVAKIEYSKPPVSSSKNGIPQPESLPTHEAPQTPIAPVVLPPLPQSSPTPEAPEKADGVFDNLNGMPAKTAATPTISVSNTVPTPVTEGATPPVIIDKKPDLAAEIPKTVVNTTSTPEVVPIQAPIISSAYKPNDPLLP